MRRLNIIFILFILAQLCGVGCSGAKENKTDVKEEANGSDSVIQEYDTLTGYFRVIGYYFAYDSARTREIMDGALWRGYIKHDYDSAWFMSGRTKFYPVKDMSYLPYLYLVESSKKYTLDSIGPAKWADYDIDWVPFLFSSVINDRLLYKTGKRLMENYNRKHDTNFRYPKTFKKDTLDLRLVDYLASGYVGVKGLCFEPSAIDTLRVLAVIHNSRWALERLEKYYHDKGDDKGLAIYYKVMLGYEGNGDLAERFYRVLEPHFKDTPEFRGAVREVLLRAAICDGNARAQELCDSLGFSLCDYRLPLPE